jgi:Glycosyl transferase family 2
MRLRNAAPSFPGWHGASEPNSFAMTGRRLQLDAVHDLVPLGPGEWRMTGSDPQFLVRGPFARGLWEWELRAGVRAETPAPAPRIYHAPDGGFSEAAVAQFSSFPPEPAARTLRFWLPYDATVLRFDPSDAPGTLILGEVTARRRGRLTATAAAFARQARRHGRRGVAAWISELAAAARRGSMPLRARMVELITADGGGDTAWVAAKVAARVARYPSTPERGLLSIVSTVYDTRPEYLRELADSLRAQTWPDYEWVLLDNGSRNAETRAALADIARDSRVTLLRAERNLGILDGMRRVLEHATGRYVLPVDSDDYLFPDALAIVAAVLQREGYPPVAYSDEDKLRDGRHVEAFDKPDWDPVLFRNCCYIAHLCAIDRRRALELGVYTDPAAEGCHDWDSFLRFARAGLPPVHVPEILYSWRMHGGSTAANVAAKDYVVNSQRHVLERHLACTGLADRFGVEPSPFFPHSPDWWIRRKRVAPTAVAVVVHGGGEIDLPYPAARVVRAAADEPPLRAWQRAAATAPAVVIVDTRLRTSSDEWLWEMVGLKESFADAAIVGGRLLDEHRMLLDSGRSADDAGYFGTALKQRTVEHVSLRLALLDSSWLLSIDPAPYDRLEARPAEHENSPASLAVLESLATTLAADAKRAGKRVVFSPFIEAIVL